jgi:NADH-quinone oxidoreductase subunit M
VKDEQNNALFDLNAKEFFVMALLAILTLLIGIYPAIISDITNQSSAVIMDLIQQSKLP